MTGMLSDAQIRERFEREYKAVGSERWPNGDYRDSDLAWSFANYVRGFRAALAISSGIKES